MIWSFPNPKTSTLSIGKAAFTSYAFWFPRHHYTKGSLSLNTVQP